MAKVTYVGMHGCPLEFDRGGVGESPGEAPDDDGGADGRGLRGAGEGGGRGRPIAGSEIEAYRRRRPEESVLYRVVQENLETFLDTGKTWNKVSVDPKRSLFYASQMGKGTFKFETGK